MKIVAFLLILCNIAWDVFLEILDQRSLRNKIPASVADVYDPEEYQKWRSYKRETKRVSVLQSVVEYAATLVLIFFDCYAAFAKLFPENMYLQLFSVILLSEVVSTVLGLPFSVYRTFVTEEKYGFNRTTRKTFIADTVKDLVLTLVLEMLLVSMFAAVHQVAGNWFIPMLAAGFVVISLLMALLAPLFTRIFNTFKPLEDGKLKDTLTEMLTKHGYKVRAVEVMDASRRSTRMNAYFTGLGPMKTIVLYDTTVEAMSEEQICAIFAHEMGHGIHHDIIWTRCLSIITALLIAFCAWVVLLDPAIFADFGFQGINYGFAVIMLGWLMSLITPLMDWVSSLISRRAEYRADATAVEEGYGEALASGLKLLAKMNLSNLSPDPLLVKLTYSHPTLAQRVEAIEAQRSQKQN